MGSKMRVEPLRIAAAELYRGCHLLIQRLYGRAVYETYLSHMFALRQAELVCYPLRIMWFIISAL